MAGGQDMDLVGGAALARQYTPAEKLDELVRVVLEAAQFDVREFWAPDGTFRHPREVPRPLMLLVKGVKMKRLAPVEWADVLGVPASEVVELKWESQAALLLRAIEVLAAAIERARKQEGQLTDEEVEAGALSYVAERHPEVAAAHPEVFGRSK